MEVLIDEMSSHRQLAIIERFDGFVNYIYPIAINIRQAHHVVKDRLIEAMFEQVSLFQQAGKSSQISKLYLADAGLAHLRFLLRFLTNEHRRLTSQLFANIYGHILDRYLTHTLRVRTWLRYMDDTVVFAHSREALAVLQHGLKWFCHASLGLTFSKWSIGPITQGLDWLGYRIRPNYKLLRRRSVLSAKRKIHRYRQSGDTLSLTRFIASWRGHAQWANSFNLLNRLGVA
jgi:hypothetical protein